MAQFLKPPWIDLTGYDRGLNRQTVTVGKYATVGLKEGVGLKVAQNNPAMATVTEQPGRDGLRVFRVNGVKAGYSMLEARNASERTSVPQQEVRRADELRVVLHQ